MTNDSDARAKFEAKVQMLVGRRVRAVGYREIHQSGPEPAHWDYGDWHHAVMGVQLTTDAGPVTVTWTNTFHPYGVEVFDDPIERHLVHRRGRPRANRSGSRLALGELPGQPREKRDDLVGSP